jgi:hypothetical protein
MNDNQKEIFHNQLDIQWKFMHIRLPAVVKGVLGVDDRNNMPFALYFNDFG